MKDLRKSTLRQYHPMLKGAALEVASLAFNPGFPHELAVGSWAIFLTCEPQFLPQYNGIVDR